jgi:hypothetical protein
MLKDFLSGPAVGEGPPQSVWAKIIEKIVSKESHWARIGEEFFSPLNLATQFVTPSDIREFKTYGLILRQSFFWGFHAYPISPFFIALMLQDIDAAVSEDFIECVAPAAAARLRTWPPPEIINNNGTRTLQLAYGVDPMALLNSTLSNIQVSSRLMQLSLRLF